MDFDRIAPFYRWFEWAAFGGRLQKHRVHFLAAATGARRALIVGDGDGRFLERLVAAHPALPVEAIDLSRKMLKLTRKRLPEWGRVHLLQADARTDLPLKGSYDLLVTHFFLDCFEQSEAQQAIESLARHAAPEATWIVSEFREPAGLVRGQHARLWLKAMYLFFRWTARLTARQLPPHRDMLAASGFVLRDERASRDGLIYSELWQRSRAQHVHS